MVVGRCRGEGSLRASVRELPKEENRVLASMFKARNMIPSNDEGGKEWGQRKRRSKREKEGREDDEEGAVGRERAEERKKKEICFYRYFVHRGTVHVIALRRKFQNHN